MWRAAARRCAAVASARTSCRTLARAARSPLANRRTSTELQAAVERSNEARARMLWRDKYDKYILNPAYGDVVSRRLRLEVSGFCVSPR